MTRQRSHYADSHIAFQDSIEWEDVPSFADSLSQRIRPLGTRPGASVAASVAVRTPGQVSARLSVQQVRAMSEAEQFNTAWNVTMPADLLELPSPQPFRETLEGLAMREVSEPEVFKHFFG